MSRAPQENQPFEKVTVQAIQITFCNGGATVSPNLVDARIKEHEADHNTWLKTPMCEVKTKPIEVTAFKDAKGNIT